LSVLPPRWPLRIPNCVDRNLPTPSTLHELRGPSAFPDSGARGADSLRSLCRRPCPVSYPSRSQGLATLSTVFATPILGDLFQPPTLLGFALQSVAPLPRSKNSSRIPLSAPTLVYKTSWALYRRFSGLLSAEKPCPCVLPNGLGRVGTSCSLELLDLSGDSLRWTWEKTFPSSFPSPYALVPAQPYDQTFLGP